MNEQRLDEAVRKAFRWTWGLEIKEEPMLATNVAAALSVAAHRSLAEARIPLRIDHFVHRVRHEYANAV